ncbi:MAG: di-trans,poly-cis-decaprenylcistransferase [Nanoarchaeota archaeon]|nr:di-trans,poly-cis-decaprenylcistransferase [Nanoarchaeota archaeon]
MVEDNNPKHIGIIMDGNRRFAKKLMMQPWKGHEWGKKKVEKLLNWCEDLDIKELSLYAFSTKNFNRPKEEFNHIMNLFRDASKDLLNDERLESKQIRIRFCGRIHMFPEDIQKSMHEIMDKTKKHNKYLINFCMAYGGREEIIDAMRAYFKDIEDGNATIKDIDESNFHKYLWVENEPELIIRTSGERRTSDFLTWQGAYSEFFFLDKHWPEFEKEDLKKCIDEYKARDRRFGK